MTSSMKHIFESIFPAWYRLYLLDAAVHILFEQTKKLNESSTRPGHVNNHNLESAEMSSGWRTALALEKAELKWETAQPPHTEQVARTRCDEAPKMKSRVHFAKKRQSVPSPKMTVGRTVARPETTSTVGRTPS